MPAPEASLPAPRDAGDARELEAATPRPSERDELPPLVPDREVHAAELATLLDDAMPYFARRAPLAFAWMRAGAEPKSDVDLPEVEFLVPSDAEFARMREQAGAFEARTRRLSPDFLDAKQFTLLLALRMAFVRDAWWYAEDGPWATEPTIALRHVEDLVSAAEWSVFGREPGELARARRWELATLLRQVEPFTAGALTRLRAASPESCAASAEHGRRLAARLAALERALQPSAQGPADEANLPARAVADARAALLAHAAKLDELATRLAADPRRASWDQALPAADSTRTPLDPRWGRARLDRVFELEEAWLLPSDFESLASANLRRFDAMRKALGDFDASLPLSGDALAARCKAVEGDLRTRLAAQLPATLEGFDCPRIAAAHPSPEEAIHFEHWVLERLVVPAHLRELRLHRGGPLSLVEGQWLPAATLRLRTVMLAALLEDPGTSAAAIEAVQVDACRGATALSVHGGLGIDLNRLERFHRAQCRQLDAEAWIEGVEDDPRRALEGVVAATLGPTPADMAELVEFGWAPAGLAPALANPQLPRDANTGDGVRPIDEFLRSE